MIDVTNVKAPGWQRIVSELTAGAPDDRAYFERLLRVIGQVSAARQAALLVPDRTDGEEVEPRVELVWPKPEIADRGEGNPVAVDPKATDYPRETADAARAVFGTAQSRIFSLDKQELYYGDGGGGQGTILAVPVFNTLMNPPPPGTQLVPTAVITMLIEPRSKDALRSTLAMAEVLAGYFYAHQARSSLRKTQQAGAALDLATRLIASINTAPNFKGACLQLANDVAKQLSADRVVLGWVKGDKIKAQAISDTEHFDRRMAMVQKLESAMDECLDQEQPILYPPPPAEGPDGDVLLSQAIVHAHRELAAGNAKLKVCSLPLRATDVVPGTAQTTEEQVIGVLTIESAGDRAIDISAIELVQAALDLVAPVLKIRRSDDKNLALRTWDSAIRAGAWAVGPRHTVWKLVSVIVFAAACFVTFYKMTYRPGADAALDPRNKRIVSMPFEGIIKQLAPGVEAGKVVKAGETLIDLDTQEWRLGMADAEGRVYQAQLQAAAARQAKDPGKAAQAEAQEKQARAAVAQYQYRLDKARITAPISGLIIAGDLKERVGSTMKTGDFMLQIAETDDIVCVAKLDERDIAMVRKAFDEGRGKGSVATKGLPAEPLTFTIEQIVPQAVATEGKNVFEVRCRIDQTPENAAVLQKLRLVAGVEGEAKFDTERRSLLWIGTRRIIDAIRLWWW